MSTKPLPNSILQWKAKAPVVGIVALVTSIAFMLVSEQRVQGIYQALLFGWVLAFGMAMGSQALLYIHHMTAGAWSFPLQRMFEASARTLKPLMIPFAIYWLGVAFGFNHNYDVWITPDKSNVLHDIIVSKGWWLDKEFWLVRTALYMVILLFMATKMSKWSSELEESGDALITLKFRKWAPVFLLVYSVIITLYPLDMVMSLEPTWFSTIYGPLFGISQFLTILVMFIILLSKLAEEKPMSAVVTNETYHMMSSFCYAFVVMWAYMSFSQFLIIWSGNLPEEIEYYLTRNTHFYVFISVIMIVGHFFAPFFALLQKHLIKTKLNRLKKVCYFILVMRLFDLFYMINPAFQEHKAYNLDEGGFISGLMAGPWLELFGYFAMGIAMLSYWLFFFVKELGTIGLMPKNDPRMYDALSHVDEELFENV